jgi:hypothetical protein
MVTILHSSLGVSIRGGIDGVTGGFTVMVGLTGMVGFTLIVGFAG